MRSIRTRLIAAVMTVMLAAVGVTAWFTNRETSREVRSAVEENLRVESEIYEALSFHAFSKGSWQGVDQLVASLAGEYGERIALTDTEGRPIADSAILLEGRERPLPDTPVAFIDPGSPVISFDTPEESPFLAGLQDLIAQGKELAARLEDAGVEFRLRASDFGIDYPVWDETDGLAEAIVDSFFRERISDGGAPLIELPPDVLGFLNDEAAGLASFLEGAGVPYRVEVGPLGLSFVDWDYDDETANRAVEDYYGRRDDLRSAADVLSIGIPEEAATPALLFLGVGGAQDPLPDPVGWRLLVVVAVLAALAVVVTVIVSRRILKPIGALTAAARRLASGRLSQRVEVRGGDEVAALGGAFNTMAASLEEQDRLRRGLTRDIAHELRTPLSNIRGYLEAIQEGVARPSPEVIASLHEEAVHLQRLIDDLQELSLAEAGSLAVDRTPTDVGQLIERVVAAHLSAAGAAGVDLVAQVRRPAVADVDAGRIRQVLANLVDNAIRHTPPGGRVTVALSSEPGEAVVEVVDTGSGIPAEHLPHLFERLYRVDPSRNRATGGSGLGLAIARELVRAHGGEITVASTVGEGSTFTVRIPV